MRFRKIALALFACMALGALAANVAQAGQWTLGTTENLTGAGTTITSEGISCSNHGTSSLELTTKLLGSPVKFTVTGIDCASATIDTTTAGVDYSAGKLIFTGVKVVEPANCEVGGLNHELTTEALTVEVIMDPRGGSAVFDKYVSETTTWFTVKFEGALCSLKGESAPVKGTACGEAAHTVEEPKESGTVVFKPTATGTLTKVQTLLFGEAQQKTGNTEKLINCALTLGKESVFITGPVENELNGLGEPGQRGQTVRRRLILNLFGR